MERDAVMWPRAVASCVVGDFERWTRVGTGVGGVSAKVMGIALTNEDVGGATI